MTYQTYKTAEDAQKCAENIFGWGDVEVTQLYLPGDKNSDEDGNAWIINLGWGSLMTDGYVR